MLNKHEVKIVKVIFSQSNLSMHKANACTKTDSRAINQFRKDLLYGNYLYIDLNMHVRVQFGLWGCVLVIFFLWWFTTAYAHFYPTLCSLYSPTSIPFILPFSPDCAPHSSPFSSIALFLFPLRGPHSLTGHGLFLGFSGYSAHNASFSVSLLLWDSCHTLLSLSLTFTPFLPPFN